MKNKRLEIERQVRVLRKAEETLNALIGSALSSDNLSEQVAAREFISKALTAQQSFTKEDKESEQKAILYNPSKLNAYYSQVDRGTYLDFSSLRALGELPLIKYITNTIIDYVCNFVVPQKDIYSTGFVIKPKNHKHGEKLSKEDERNIAYITEFVLNCGDPKYVHDGDDFEQFTRKVMQDSLTLDALAFENVFNRYGSLSPKGRITRFVAVDGSTIRRSAEMSVKGLMPQEKPAYVQIYQGYIQAEFFPKELAYGMRNISTDIERMGYGKSEIENLLPDIASFVFANEYNRNFFRNGSHSKGFFLAKNEDVTKARLLEFERAFVNQTRGVDNAFKTPVLNASKFEYVDMSKTNNDMQFYEFLYYLVEMICAGYRIDPILVGFNTIQNGGVINNQGNGKDKFEYSKHKFLYPLLKFYQKLLNKFVINGIDDRYELCFVGLDGVTRETELAQRKEEISVYKTINEVRKEYGYEPVKGGDIIANPQYIAYLAQLQNGGETNNAAVEEMDEEMKKAQNDFRDLLSKSI